jgi:hypothetical protein
MSSHFGHQVFGVSRSAFVLVLESGRLGVVECGGTAPGPNCTPRPPSASMSRKTSAVFIPSLRAGEGSDLRRERMLYILLLVLRSLQGVCREQPPARHQRR